MPKKSKRKRPKRGYPVAILIGLDKKNAHFWKIYSEQIKPDCIVKLKGKRIASGDKNLYKFHEEIVNILRPQIKEGLRSLILVSEPKTDYTKDFLEHIKKHHLWLTKDRSNYSISIGTLDGRAGNIDEISELTGKEGFKLIIEKTVSSEADDILKLFEKRINDEKSNYFSYSLEEIEHKIFSLTDSQKMKPEYLLITEKYLKKTKYKNGINRLIQIAQNKKIKTKIIKEEITAADRLDEFGGIILM